MLHTLPGFFFHYNFYWLSCSLVETLCDIRTDEVMYIMLLVIVACTCRKCLIFFFFWLVFGLLFENLARSSMDAEINSGILFTYSHGRVCKCEYTIMFTVIGQSQKVTFFTIL